MLENQQIFGPLLLFALMAVVGLELTVADFRRVLEAPRAVVGGTLAQLALLPLSTWVVVALLGLPPVFGAGAVLVAVSPGAGMSNILTAVAGANTALSVTLTAVSSTLAVITLPAFSALAMGLFLDDAVGVDVPVALLVGQLTFSLLLPISLGMWVRARWPEFVFRHGRRLQRITVITLCAIVMLAVAVGEAEGGEFGFEAARAGILGAILWTLLAMGIGWSVATLLGLPDRDRFTFLIEFSARNVAVAAIVALSGLQRLDLTLFAGAYMIAGYPLCVIATVVRRRLARDDLHR